MAFLRSIWKASSKHKKLSDEWDLTPKSKLEMQEIPQACSTFEGIAFAVKYIGSTKIDSAGNPKATAEAVKNIVNIAKNGNIKAVPVQLTISLRGILVKEVAKKTILFDISLYRISYCSADATYGHVFAFIARNETDDALVCHAFLCPKRKTTQFISITVAQTFNTAFHLWEMSQQCGLSEDGKTPGRFIEELSRTTNSKDNKRPSVIQQVLTPIPMLIDLTTPIDSKPNQWMRFED